MDLEFKRQFIMGKRVLEKEWNQTTVNNEYFLSTEKSLEVNQIKEKGKELTLIGYMINPHKPNDTNIDCLKSVFNNANSLKDINEELYIYSGRFILISVINNEMIILTDTSGLRQVYYTSIKDELWLASQPNLLAYYFNLSKRKDEQIINFISSSSYEKSQRSWIGNDCIFEDVYHLMPNTFIDVNSVEIKRYWVNHEKERSYQEAVTQAALILKGSMNAIAKRGNLIQGLTAGWDSRMLLAASEEIEDDVIYYTSLGDDKPTKSTDLKIAKKIARNLDLNLHVMDELEDVRDEIGNNIKKNVTQGRVIKKTRTIQYFYDNFSGKINVNGNISEIVRNFYGLSHPPISADYLVGKLNYENIPFVKDNINNWLNSIPDNVKEDIELPDLMYWEQRMGNWCAMQKAEQDIALEDFSPFNNRQLIMTLYSVDKKYRKPETYVLYKDIMEVLWKEVLIEPINPVSLRIKIRKGLSKIIPSNIKLRIRNLVKS